MKLKSPHIFLASSNVRKMLENVRHVISKKSQRAIEKEIQRHVTELYTLGESHRTFAKALSANEWRQKISRLYYAAYNCSRAIRLEGDGVFSTDSSDHSTVGDVPSAFPNQATYKNKLKTLREDRNLCDYSHESNVGDLVIPLPDAEQLVDELFRDAKAYLRARGVRV